MRKRKWLYTKIILFLVVFFAMKKFAEDRTDGFTVVSIAKEMPYNASWETPTEDVSSFLNQRFYYYGRGGQSYVFISEDKKVILKFFKKTPFSDLNSIFQSCKLAYDNLKKETGLLYLHLNPTQGNHTTVQIVDPLRIVHTIDLDKTSFILQKRAKLIYAKIDQEMKCGNVNGAKKAISSLLSYLAHRCQQGIRDTDGGLKRNYGFVGDYAISIDIGSFTKDKRLENHKIAIKELKNKTARLQKWLKKRYPELSGYFRSELEMSSKGLETGSSCP